MKKCISCLWRIKVNESVSLCLFARCVKEDGFKVDKEEVNGDGKQTTKAMQ